MNFKNFVSYRFRAASLRADLKFTREQSYPYQRRVAAHCVSRLGQIDAAGSVDDTALELALKQISSDEDYVQSVMHHARSSDLLAARLLSHWIGAFALRKTDGAYFEFVDTSLWTFVNSVLTAGQVADMIGLPDPDRSERAVDPADMPNTSVTDCGSASVP